MPSRALMAVVAACVVLAPAPALAADGYTFPPAEHVPDVLGDGILFAYSGLDGKTRVEPPMVATLAGGGLTLKFHFENEPALRILLAENHRLTWRVVSNDLLVADVAGDDMPLVVGFTSAKVVVGRLPSGARATLTGGGSTTVILRDKVGERSRFALAYDAGGPQVAARVAAQALKVSIETLIEGRLDFFAKAPHGDDNLRARPAEALAKAFSVMKVNVYGPEPPLTVHWTTPSRWPERRQNAWATAFHALGLMHLDTHLAKEALVSVYLTQEEDGHIPGWSGPATAESLVQPPLLAQAALTVYRHDKMRDRRFLQAAFDAGTKQVEWFLKNRRFGEAPPPEKPLTYGVPLHAWSTAEEAGMPGSPRFATGTSMAAIDLSTYLAVECRTLQHMAQRLGLAVSARTWGQRADELAEAIRTHLWNAEKGFFFDRQGADGPWSETWSVAGFLPLALGVATNDQARRLADHLASDRFRGTGGILTLARDQTGYTGEGWRGAVSMPMTYLVIRGLQQQGLNPAARRLAQRAVATITDRYHEAGTLDAFYAAGGTGSAAPDPGTRDYFPTAAVFADLLLRPEP